MEKDYRELYEKITNSDWFKKAYRDKSLGECPIVIEELEESEDEKIRSCIYDVIKENDWSHVFGVKKEDCLAYIEKQKEQKPAEWKPLEESMEALLLAIEGKWDAIKPTGYMSRRLEDLYDGLVNTFNIRETYLPKTNYTEKDIEELKTLKSKIDASMEQKPAEWSEEEQQIIEDAAGTLINFSNTVETEEEEEELCELASKLQDLKPQPQWKPSEEQMDALFTASERNDKLGSILNSLYYDLKKL